MVDLSFFEKRRSSLPFYLVAIAITLFLLYMVWPWNTLDIDPLGWVRSVVANGVA